MKKTMGGMYDSKFMQLKSFISEVARLWSKEMQVSHQNPDHLADAEVVPEVWRVSLPERVLCGNAPTFAAFSRQSLDTCNWNVETIEVEEGTRTRENFEDNVVDNENNVVTDIEDNGHVIVPGGEDNLAFKAGSDVEDK